MGLPQMDTAESPAGPHQAEPASGTAARIADLAAKSRSALAAGSAQAVQRQHAKGKLTARERIDLFVDPDSFVELDQLARSPYQEPGGDASYGDGVVTGHATVDGRPVCLFAQDFTVYGGSMGEAFGQRILKVMDLAMKIGCPIIGLNDSGGARIQEGVVSLAYYAELARRHTAASGVVPQISLIMGPCAGGAVYCPAMTDFVVMVDRTAHMFVTGPEPLQAVLGEQTTAEELGGGRVNSTVSGNVHHLATDEQDGFDYVRELLSFLPSNNLDPPPVYDSRGEARLTPADLALDSIVPDEPNRSYDMFQIIRTMADDEHLLEVSPLFAPNIICCFIRVEGRPVAVVANQPAQLAGTIDINASEKAARFVRFCDAFNIPLLTFADVPGYLPGRDQERGGIIRRGAKLIYAYAEATVPKVTVVIRKAYGGGYAVMGSKHLGADLNLAWPTAEIAVMGATSAVGLLHRKALNEAGADAEALRTKLVQEYRETIATPYVAAGRGYLDAVIRPAETRRHVVRAMRLLADKSVERPRRKHGNIPL